MLINPIKVFRFLGNIKKSWLFPFTILVISTTFLITFSNAKAQDVNVSSARDCDSNAVIYCGAGATSSLVAKYNQGDGRNSAQSIHNIYSFFGISSADMNNMMGTNDNVIWGHVTKSGEVMAANRVVATDAITGGRENISGSTAQSVGGTTFFVRPPSVSFQSQELAAFVVMENGTFKFAVIASCGNAVKARPVVAPAPTPKPTPPPTPTPPAQQSVAPSNFCSGNVSNTTSSISSQGGNCSTNTTVVQNTETKTTPPPAPTSPPATPSATPVAATPTALVNTGPGGIIALFAGVSSASTLVYQVFLRKIAKIS